MGLIASESGIKKVNEVRKRMGYGKTSVMLQDKVNVSESTLKGFWYRTRLLREDNFRSICYVFGFTDEQIDNEIIDWENSTDKRKNIESENPLLPFGYKGCIRDTGVFFDRQDTFKTLYQNLKLGWSCSLVGECQIGKSSILWKLCQEGHKNLNLLPKNLIYIDLQYCSTSEVLLKELNQQLNTKINNYTDGFEIRRKLSNKCFILCLDEMEVLTRFPHDDLDSILNLFRALAGENTLTLVTASRSPLSQLFPDSPNQPSPLNNIFHTITVKPFTEADARDFIDYRLQDTKIKFTNEQIDKLINQSQCHPATLQEQAHQLYLSLIDE